MCGESDKKVAKVESTARVDRRRSKDVASFLQCTSKLGEEILGEVLGESMGEKTVGECVWRLFALDGCLLGPISLFSVIFMVLRFSNL